MEEFNTINEIIQTGIQTSSYNSVIISSCVFIAYTLGVKVIDLIKAKDKNKPMIEMGKAITEVSNNVIKLNNILDKYIQNNERKESDKIKKVIELAFVNFQCKIEAICRDIVIHNNIEQNKEYIVSNIKQTINTEYYKLYSTLSLYELNNRLISTHIKEVWIEDICKDVIVIIYNNQDAKNRIAQISNKLSIKMSNYSTYTYNKTFND